MKKFVVLLVLLCGLMVPTAVSAAKTVRGVVVYYNDSSDKIIIQTDNGFTCGEVMSGGWLYLKTGHLVIGTLESYGTYEIYNATKDRTFRLWVDEYWLDTDAALDWLGR